MRRKATSPPPAPPQRWGRTPTDPRRWTRVRPATWSHPGPVIQGVLAMTTELPSVARVARPLTRWAVRAGVVTSLLTGLVGLMHLPAAAPLVRRILPASVCPLTRGTPEQIDRA